MKKLLVLFMVLAFAALPTAPAFANDAYGNGPGCGLGGDIFKGNKAILHQVLAATTNGTFGLQTFGITTGTIGCTNNGKFAQSEQETMFANLNFDNLSQEMAQGGGEHLASLATLMGVPAEQQPAFFSMTQEKYTALIQSGETTPAAMLKALHETMAAHPVLAKVSLAR
jgi:endonuclease/exonuclease/phosphatase (EEP) superfamily protein YafD